MPYDNRLLKGGVPVLFLMQTFTTEEERRSFEALYQKYRRLMRAAAMKLLSDPQDAEDAVQQALLSILKIIEKISEVKCPKTRALIVTIIERKSIDLYRAKQRRSVLPLNEEQEDAFIVGLTALSELEAAELRTDFARAISLLPAKYRELILLKYDYGFSDSEIAAMLDMTEANVRKTTQRAKKKLEMILEGQEG